MKAASGRALLHVALASCLCVAAVRSGVFDSVFVQVGREHYAEAPLAGLPAFLAMPFNSLVNLAYVLLGAYWLQSEASAPGGPAEVQRARYLKDVFAGMALVYGPVQWLRIATQTRAAAVLDQWLTLPIFAWPVAWCLCLDWGWKPWLLLAVEGLSLSSYGLALLHPCGFELALGVHMATAWARPCAPRGAAAARPRQSTWPWACSPAWALWSSSCVTISLRGGLSSSGSRATSGPKSATCSSSTLRSCS
uniref:Transmembrane protein 187 n=1 Tax=Sus scrofa TaxID=9823 RepID=A0A5G2R7G5_PIG